MGYLFHARIELTCDCGQRFAIPYAWIHNEIACPACQNSWSLPPEKIANIEHAFAQAMAQSIAADAAGVERPIGIAEF